MTAPDDRPPRAAHDHESHDHDVLAEVDVDDAAPAAQPGDERVPRAGRRWLPLVALAVPVVAVVAVLGWRAAAGPAFDPEAAGNRVWEHALGISDAEGGTAFGGGAAGPGAAMSGGSSQAPERGARDVTVVCASEHGRGAHLTVAVAGETVGEADVACSDGGDPDADPQVTVLPLDELGGDWSFEVESETLAALAVVLS